MHQCFLVFLKVFCSCIALARFLLGIWESDTCIAQSCRIWGQEGVTCDHQQVAVKNRADRFFLQAFSVLKGVLSPPQNLSYSNFSMWLLRNTSPNCKLIFSLHTLSQLPLLGRIENLFTYFSNKFLESLMQLLDQSYWFSVAIIFYFCSSENKREYLLVDDTRALLK